MASAQDIYNSSSYPGAEPVMSASDAMFNWYDSRWSNKVANYYADRREWEQQKLLQNALWERDDSYYQRLVKDMSKAGLNPYYALNNNLVSPGNSSALDYFKTRKNKEKEKDVNLKGFLVTAMLLLKLLA